MSKTVLVRYQTRSETAEENQRLVEEVFDELASDGPEGLRYATFRLADGVTFVHVAVFDGAEEALSNSAAFQRFQDRMEYNRFDGVPHILAILDLATGTMIYRIRRRKRSALLDRTRFRPWNPAFHLSNSSLSSRSYGCALRM